MTALSWLLLAVAFLAIAPPARVPTRPGLRPRGRPTRGSLQLVTAVALVPVCVLGFGLHVGVGVAFVVVPVGVLLVGRLADRPRPSTPDASLALTLDLIAVGLRAGQPIAAALAVAAPAAEAPTDAVLQRVSALLRLGADADEAWRLIGPDDPLAAVATTARRSAHSGVRMAESFTRLAAQVRADRRLDAERRAQRAGVFAMAPLGLCFLPAFVCLGVVPTVAGIAGDVLTGLR